jgi:asparagine synthase (glutamine-hydrolysing)
MCGIAGFIDFKKTSTRVELEAMTHTLAHRGPDGSGTFFEENNAFQLGLGHRRLAVLELSELGKQPMTWLDFTIVFNGEIYNFNEIRNELIRLGHSFQSHSDTETILHAYKQWGTTCVHHFIGMFAFVIYNAATKEVFIARDRTGVKPLFVYQTTDLLLFASELKAFHAHPRFVKKVNHSAVHAFLQFGYVPTPHCIFENCTKIEPGKFVHFRLSEKLQPLSQQTYWNVNEHYNKPKLSDDYSEIKATTHQLLQSACNYRMVADVPVGVFLSGGYDSTCVTALLQKNQTEQLKTFTVAVPDIGLNEAPYAAAIAEHLETKHTTIDCDTKEAMDIIATLPYFYDEPFADSSAIPTMLVSKVAQEQVSVALSADGGDEVFGGYQRYEMIQKYSGKLAAIHPFVRKGTAKIMQTIPAEKIPIFNRTYNFVQRYEKIKALLTSSNNQSLLLSLSQLFTDEQLSKIVKEDVVDLITNFDSKELINPSPLAYAMATDYKTYLIDDILQKVDRAAMSIGLESREPLLDHRLIEYMAQVPDEFKIRNNEKKWLLKEIVHEYVPKTLLDRPKMGFAIPIENWLNNELKPLVTFYLSEQRIKQGGFFHWSEVAFLINSFFNGRKEFGVKLWYLLTFEMWREKWAI